jgi:phosphoglycerate dehydrogenase-like enzyme
VPRVFIFAPSGNMDSQLREAGCDTVLGLGHWHAPGGNYYGEMVPMAAGADGMIGVSNRAAPITRQVLDAAPDLRVVAKNTIGVDDIDVDACTDLGILVTHAPVESNWGGIAEETMAMMLHLAKRLSTQDAYIKEGNWQAPGVRMKYIGARASDGYKGLTIGIIGLGRIGVRMCHLLRPWNARLIAYDPYVPFNRFLEAGATSVDLETLLKESDIVTLHPILTKETRNMIGRPQLAMMKPGSIVLNTARGGLIDEDAVAEALESGHLAGAGFKAYAEEPLAPDSPLRRAGDKIVMLPHGGYGLIPGFAEAGQRTAESGTSLAGGGGTDWAVECVLDALRGEVPKFVYNTEVVPQWLTRFGGKDILSPQPVRS